MFTGNVLKTLLLYSKLTVETADVLGCFAKFCCCHFSKSKSSTEMSHIVQSAWNNTASMENSVTAKCTEEHRSLRELLGFLCFLL